VGALLTCKVLGTTEVMWTEIDQPSLKTFPSSMYVIIMHNKEGRRTKFFTKWT